MTREDSEDAVTAAIGEFAATYEQVQARLAALSPRDQFDAWTRLREVIGDMEIRAADMRAQTAHRILLTEEGLSLAALARSLGRSPERISQLVRQARGVQPQPWRHRGPRSKPHSDEPTDDQ